MICEVARIFVSTFFFSAGTVLRLVIFSLKAPDRHNPSQDRHRKIGSVNNNET